MWDYTTEEKKTTLKSAIIAEIAKWVGLTNYLKSWYPRIHVDQLTQTGGTSLRAVLLTTMLSLSFLVACYHMKRLSPLN